MYSIIIKPAVGLSSYDWEVWMKRKSNDDGKNHWITVLSGKGYADRDKALTAANIEIREMWENKDPCIGF